jgi:NAD(P)-dependent dehydrogenase (short-subunit alcohol dehydrogenase family)
MNHKVVLITGGTRGVGHGIAVAFLEAGATVITCGRTEPSPADRQRERLSYLAADVRDPVEASNMIDQIARRHGRLDVLINNAGGSPPADSAKVSRRFIEAIVRLNLVAPMMLSELANGVMQGQERGGVIINIASLSGLRPSPGTAAYGAAKAGIIAATESLSVSYAPRVRVNCVTPGAIETPELHKLYGGDSYFADVAATVPMGRMGQPRDVADACLFLVSDAAAFITGSNILVHGGGDSPPEVRG